MPIKLYEVDKTYIDYLISFDSEVRQHKNSKRPYLFVQMNINNKDYLIPLSSPKNNKTRTNALVDVILNKNRIIGYLEYHKMIPFNSMACNIININNITDIKYRNLIIMDLAYIRNILKINAINNKANIVYNDRYNINAPLYKKLLSKFACDFDLLEKLSDKYIDFINGKKINAYKDNNNVWVVEIKDK